MKRFKRIVAGLLITSMFAISVATDVTYAYASEVDITEEQTPVIEETLVEESSVEATTQESSSDEDLGTEETSTEEVSTEEESTEAETTPEPAALKVADVKAVTEIGTKAEYIALFDKASKALRAIANEKDIYALIYLTEVCAVRELPNNSSAVVANLESAHTVRIIDVGADVDSILEEEYANTRPEIWYKIRFYVGDDELEGYVPRLNLAYSDDLLLAWEEEYAALTPVDEMESVGASSDVEQFPYQYQSSLQKLKDSHSNWKFVPMKVDSSFESNVKKQSGWSGGQPYSMVSSSAPAEYKDKDMGSGWYSATEAAVRHYMDPRNWLDEKSVFMFEQESFNSSYHSEDALQKFLNGTYFSNQAGTIYNVGKNQSISPFYLASRIISEQGKDGSQMVFGKYPGYEGYYNHFNIGATGTGTTALVNGLTYARNHGWNTPAKSIEGGASTLGNNYIKRGQDTFYLQKFDLVTGNMHQYMQALHAPYNDASSMYKLYSNTGSLNSAFVFKIPVYNDLWENKYELNITSATLKKGATTKLVLNKNGSPVALDNTKVVKSLTVNHSAQKYTGKAVSSINKSTGVITANTSGKSDYTIVVHDSDSNKDITLKCSITVLSPVTHATINKSSITLYSSGSTEPTAENYEHYPATFTPSFTSTATLSVDIKAIRDAYAKDIAKEGFPYDTTDNYTVAWSIDDKSVATLSDKKDYTNATASASPHTYSTVKVTARGGGWATVTATVTVAKSKVANARTYTQKCKVYVRKPMMAASFNKEGLPLSSNNLILKVGQRQKMTLLFSPLDTTDNIEMKWEIPEAAKNIVEVKDDYIIAKGEGSCTVDAIVGPFYYDDECTKYGQFRCRIKVIVSSYYATFMDGGLQFTKDEITYGKTLGDANYTFNPWTKTSADPSKMFMGWYSEINGKGKQITKDTIVNGNITAYAYYESISSVLHAKPLGSYEYTGNRIYPVVEAYYGTTPLVRGVDYTLTYDNNVDAADYMAPKHPVAKIVGKGQYQGMSLELPFSIYPKNLADSDIVAKDYYVAYDGKVHKYAPEVTWADRTLKNKRDYTFTFTDVRNGAYKEQGNYVVAIMATPGGNYTGTRKSYIYITKNTLVDDLTITYGDSKTGFNNFHKENYTGKEIKPAITIKEGKTTLKGVSRATYEAYEKASDKEKVNYIYEYANNKEIGTADIIITGVNRYMGTKTMHFKIVGTSMMKVSVSGIKTLTYEGVPVYQKTDGGKANYMLKSGTVTLKEDVDYKVEYSNNDKVGVGKITFIGKGKYTGYITRNFIILPKVSGGSSSSANVSAKSESENMSSTATKEKNGNNVVPSKLVTNTRLDASKADGNSNLVKNNDIILTSRESKDAEEYIYSTGRSVTGIMVYSLEAIN